MAADTVPLAGSTGKIEDNLEARSTGDGTTAHQRRRSPARRMFGEDGRRWQLSPQQPCRKVGLARLPAGLADNGHSRASVSCVPRM